MTEGSRIRIIPDVHYDKDRTIGTTMTMVDKEESIKREWEVLDKFFYK